MSYIKMSVTLRFVFDDMYVILTKSTQTTPGVRILQDRSPEVPFVFLPRELHIFTVAAEILVSGPSFGFNCSLPCSYFGTRWPLHAKIRSAHVADKILHFCQRCRPRSPAVQSLDLCFTHLICSVVFATHTTFLAAWRSARRVVTVFALHASSL